MVDDVEPGMTDKEFSEFKVDEEVKAIVLDFTYGFNYRMISIIGLYLHDPNIIFVSTCADPTHSTG